MIALTEAGRSRSAVAAVSTRAGGPAAPGLNEFCLRPSAPLLLPCCVVEEGAFGCSWIAAKLFRADVGPAGRRRTVHSTGCNQAVGTESPGVADCGAQPPPITPRTMSTPPAVGVAASSSAPFLNKSLKLLAMVAKLRRPWPTLHHRMVGG
jgi:hypothetical protein